MANRHYAVVVGARPNFMKLAPLMKELPNHPEVTFAVIHTGQHSSDNMSKVFFDELGIPEPNNKLEFVSFGKTISDLRDLFNKMNCDGVIVFGDVNSTLAAAVAAQGRILIHIEAGLRSHDLRMPEEVNRIAVDHLADILFTTDASADANLHEENLDSIRVGNLMIENLILNLPELKPVEPYYVATFHRKENREKVNQIMNLLNNLNLPVILSVHPSMKTLIPYGLKNITYVNPMGYKEFIDLVANSSGVITDSGGIQDETSYLGIPCATIRENTERPRTITHGTNKLFSIDPIGIADEIEKHLRTNRSYRQDFWDVGTSKRIFQYL